MTETLGEGEGTAGRSSCNARALWLELAGVLGKKKVGREGLQGTAMFCHLFICAFYLVPESPKGV